MGTSKGEASTRVGEKKYWKCIQKGEQDQGTKLELLLMNIKLHWKHGRQKVKVNSTHNTVTIYKVRREPDQHGGTEGGKAAVQPSRRTKIDQKLNFLRNLFVDSKILRTLIKFTWIQVNMKGGGVVKLSCNAVY